MFFYVLSLTELVKSVKAEKKFQFIAIFVEVDVLFQPSGSRTSHGQIQKVREGRRNENVILFSFCVLSRKTPNAFEGSQNHTRTHTLHETSHLIFICMESFHRPLMNSEMILLMGRALKPALIIIWKLWELKNWQKLARALQISRRTSGKTLKSLKKLHTSTSTWSPALHLFRKDSVKVYKTELKQVHPKAKGFTPLTPNSIGSQMRNESWSIWEIFWEQRLHFQSVPQRKILYDFRRLEILCKSHMN